MSDFKGYNLALIPEKSVVDGLEAYSQKLAENNPSDYVLGISSIPHVSIIQFSFEKNNLSSLWSDIQNFKLEIPSLTLHQIYHNEGSSYIWHGISIKKSSELIKVHKQLLKIKTITDVKNSFGKNYFPHFTLGAVPKEDFSIKNYDMNFDLIKLENISCKLCIGRSGPQYQLEEILYE